MILESIDNCFEIYFFLFDSSKFTLLQFDDLKKTLNCSFGKQQCFIKVDLLESTGMVKNFEFK